MKLHSVALAAATILAMGSAHADTFSVAGNITLTDAVFNRPTTLTSLSAVGTAVHYDTLTFSGADAGAYNFRMISTVATPVFDTFLALYSGAFNPASPLTNLVALNDDFTTIASGSGFTFTVAAATSYTVVSTAFANTGVGSYLTTVTPVPEPATYALMALGLVGIGSLVRRRSNG